MTKVVNLITTIIQPNLHSGKKNVAVLCCSDSLSTFLADCENYLDLDEETILIALTRTVSYPK